MQGLFHGGLEVLLIEDFFAHGFGIKGITAAAQGLHAFLRHGSPVQHVVDAAGIAVFHQVAAARHFHAEAFAGQFFEMPEQLRGVPEARLHFRDIPVSAEHHEVVRRGAGEGLFGTETGGGEVGPVLEQAVAHVVAVHVVDIFEVAEIAVPQGVFAPGARDEQARGVQLEFCQVAVARDRVMLGPVAELAHGAHVAVHISDGAHNTGRAAAAFRRTVTATRHQMKAPSRRLRRRVVSPSDVLRRAA